MVKVFLPTWNSVTTLKQCLEGIKHAVPNAEIHVLDHASIDDTKTVALHYGKYEVFMGNLGEVRAYICKLTSERKEWFLMVDSDIILHPDFFYVAKRFIAPNIGAVFGRKISTAKKLRRYEEYLYNAFDFPAVNSRRLDCSCVLLNSEAVKGFSFHGCCFEDYELGKHIIGNGFKHIFIDTPCLHLGFDDFRVYLAHARWSGAGAKQMNYSPFWKVLASVVYMPLKSPCPLTTFQIRLHYFFGFLFSKYFFEYRRECWQPEHR